jgi:hypothetical protein
MRGISWLGLLMRFVFAVVLVFATYNPSAYSYYSWVAGTLPDYSVLMIFAGVVLLIGWTILLRATLRSLGPFGLLLAIAFFGVLLWLVVDMGLLPADSTQAITYLILIALSGVLATGVSWSHVRRRISGQADIDDVDEN